MIVAAREPGGARAAPSMHFRERQLIFGDITMTTTVEKPVSRVTAAEIRAALAIERSTVSQERSYGYRHWETAGSLPSVVASTDAASLDSSCAKCVRTDG